VIWTAFACLFAFLLAASRVPEASAQAGDFLAYFAEPGSTRGYPARSLWMLGGLAALACLADLGIVITALLATRILVQFIGQILSLHRVHRLDPSRLRFHAPWYPIPPLVALTGWIFAFAKMEYRVMVYGLAAVAIGASCFALWDGKTQR
jgi:fructoselysine transporter